MTIAIMQPYLFPYIGYWQLISAVDTFVIYDDVNYINKGYINRNNILVNGQKQSFTLELLGASQNKLINEIKIGNNTAKILKTIKQNYSKAPYFENIFPLIENILMQDEKNIAKFIGHSLQEISKYLRLTTTFVYSSAIHKENSLKAQDKVLEICKILGADNYINAIGGQELYSKEIFSQSNIELRFLKTEIEEYKQFNNEFVPYLSIIDIMMFNSQDMINEMLKRYVLI
jgi:hypothetical protein